MDENEPRSAANKRASLAATPSSVIMTPSPSHRRRRRLITGSSPGCVPRPVPGSASTTPSRVFRTPPPRRLLPPTAASSSARQRTPLVAPPRVARSTPVLRLDDDDGASTGDDAFSIISGDGSPERDSHVLDFLNFNALPDGTPAFTLFAPSPAASTSGGAARTIKHELVSSGLLTPQASPQRTSATTSSKNVSPSHYFRSPYSKSRSNSTVSSPFLLRLTGRERKQNEDQLAADGEMDEREHEPEPRGGRGDVAVKTEQLLDAIVCKLPDGMRSSSSTPSSSASSVAWRRNSLSLMHTPSPATNAKAKSSRAKAQLRLSAARDPFGSSDDECELPTKSRRLHRGNGDDDSASSAVGGANDQDWLFSFANTLSPLAGGAVNDDEDDLETSFLTLRFSPAAPSSIDLQRLLPPFSSPGFGQVESTNLFRTAPTPKTPLLSATSESSAVPFTTAALSSSTSKSSGGSASSASSRELNESFPKIRASTSATPGRDERLKVSSSSVMKMRLHVTFDQVQPLHTKREMEAINNSLKRRKHSRKRKLDETKQRPVKTNTKGLNVQRKLLQTPVKEDPPSRITAKPLVEEEVVKVKPAASTNRKALQALNRRSAQRKLLGAVDEDSDAAKIVARAAPVQASASASQTKPNLAVDSHSEALSSALTRRLSPTLVSVSTATLPSNLASAVHATTLQPLKLRKKTVTSDKPADKRKSNSPTTTETSGSMAPASTPALAGMLLVSASTHLANQTVPQPTLPAPSSESSVTTPVKPPLAAQQKSTEITPLPASKGGFLANPRVLVTPPQKAATAIPTAVAAGSGAGAPKKKTPCNCKKSKCLKLYCECFASGGYCDESCNCTGCANTPATEAIRQQAIASRLEKNPNAFKPKIESTVSSGHLTTPGDGVHTGPAGHGFSTPNSHHQHSHTHGVHGNGQVTGDVKKMHKHGCHCKKSACQKRYCECFQAGVPCGDNCRCIDCKNQSPCMVKSAGVATPLSAISIRGPGPRELIRGPVTLAAAGTPGEQFVSPPEPSIRQRLRIDRETWARNFSSPFEVSPRRERERTERLRAQLKNSRASALVRSFNSSTTQPPAAEVAVKAEPGVAVVATPSLKFRVNAAASFASPLGESPVPTTARPPRSLSPLSDATRPPPAPTPTGKSARQRYIKRFAPYNPHALEALEIGRNTPGRVYVLPLFGDGLPPVMTEVSAKVFHFLTNADVYNASLVNRLWSRVTMGDTVWDHCNFRRLPTHHLTDDEVGDVTMQG